MSIFLLALVALQLRCNLWWVALWWVVPLWRFGPRDFCFSLLMLSCVCSVHLCALLAAFSCVAKIAKGKVRKLPVCRAGGATVIGGGPPNPPEGSSSTTRRALRARRARCARGLLFILLTFGFSLCTTLHQRAPFWVAAFFSRVFFFSLFSPLKK